MKNSELMLFFFIIYSIISNSILLGMIYYIHIKNVKLEEYNEEIFLELVKNRK